MPRRKPAHPESVSQRLFVSRVRLDPRTKDLVIAAIPNGGKRGAREAALMKGEGVLAGMPDIIVAVARQGVNGLWIEFKHGKNKPSPAQRAVIEKLRAAGYRVEVVYSEFEAWAVLCDYLGIAP